MFKDKFCSNNKFVLKIKKIIEDNDWWYHVMDLGYGLTTPDNGYGPNLLPVAKLMRNIEFNNLKCLDIGTMDGKMAFLMEKLGANVVAVDVFKRDTIVSLIDLFQSTVRYEFGIRDQEFPLILNKFGLFDFILCSGVLYHVFSPFDVILNVRKLVKNKGYVLFESACTPEKNSLSMTLNHGDIYKECTTIWVPSIACMRYMIKYAFFQIVAEATLYFPDLAPRHAILAQALPPSELVSLNVEDTWLRKIYSGETPGKTHDYLKPQVDLQTFETVESTSVVIKDLEKEWTVFEFQKKKDFREEENYLRFGTPAK